MKKILTGALAATALASSVAGAATTTTTFQVTATVAVACSATASDLAFGTFNPAGGAALAGSSTIAVRCTNGTPFTLALNAGTTAGGTFAQRLMASGANTLQYNLYTTAALATIWGDGSASTGTVGNTGLGLATDRNVTVFGEIPNSVANQNAAAGAFSDTITVTVTY